MVEEYTEEFYQLIAPNDLNHRLQHMGFERWKSMQKSFTNSLHVMTWMGLKIEQ